MTLSQSDVRNIMDHYPDGKATHLAFYSNCIELWYNTSICLFVCLFVCADEEKLKRAIRQRYVEAMAYCQKAEREGNIRVSARSTGK